MAKFIELPKIYEDMLTTACLDLGATGFSEVLDFEQTSEIYDARILPKEKINIDVYFDNPPQQEALLELKSRFSAKAMEFKSEGDKDWMAEWKKGFHAFELFSPYWVVPSWEKLKDESVIQLKIDPGLAFGTGTHDTTKLASEILVRATKEMEPGFSVIDVGTGTGILAMMAYHQGAKKIVCTEIDEMAADTAKENLKLNNIPNVDVHNCDLEEIQGEYDFVIANIIDGVLTHLQEDLFRLLKPGGRMILSGVMKEREPVFSEKFQIAYKMKLLSRLELGEWLGFEYFKELQ